MKYLYNSIRHSAESVLSASNFWIWDNQNTITSFIALILICRVNRKKDDRLILIARGRNKIVFFNQISPRVWFYDEWKPDVLVHFSLFSLRPHHIKIQDIQTANGKAENVCKIMPWSELRVIDISWFPLFLPFLETALSLLEHVLNSFMKNVPIIDAHSSSHNAREIYKFFAFKYWVINIIRYYL